MIRPDPQEERDPVDEDAEYWERWDAVIESRGLEDEPWDAFDPQEEAPDD